jgi:hypothetical protein
VFAHNSNRKATALDPHMNDDIPQDIHPKMGAQPPSAPADPDLNRLIELVERIGGEGEQPL